MLDQTIKAVFSNNRSGDLSSYVKLEQVGFEAQIGQVTKTDLVKGISAELYGSVAPTVDCGLSVEGGRVCYRSKVHAYVYPSHLDFRVGITNGTLFGGSRKLVSVMERVKFKLSNTAQLRYGVVKIASIKWEGDVWNKKGQVTRITKPTLINNQLEVSDFVYGTAIVEYFTMRIDYEATIFHREESLENTFDSVAWAAWDGGVDMLVLESPTGASDDTLLGVGCSGRSGSRTTITEVDGSERDLPTADPVDLSCGIHYCTGKKRDETCGTNK